MFNILGTCFAPGLQVYAAAGTVKNNYVNILWMLLRLRQACDHRQLVKGLSSHTPQESAIEAVEKLSEEERGRLLALAEANVSICSICNVSFCLV